jgi:hypothetical protein
MKQPLDKYRKARERLDLPFGCEAVGAPTLLRRRWDNSGNFVDYLQKCQGRIGPVSIDIVSTKRSFLVERRSFDRCDEIPGRRSTPELDTSTNTVPHQIYIGGPCQAFLSTGRLANNNIMINTE